MEQTIIQKTFLDSDDICCICDCCKTKSYQIINDINKKLNRKGFSTFKGKVLAIEVYKTFNMVDYLQSHDNYWSKIS